MTSPLGAYATPAARSTSPHRQYDLLAFLARNRGHVLDRRQIQRAVWGYLHDPGTNVVDVYIGYVRRKLATPAGPLLLITTVRSRGYRLEEPPRRSDGRAAAAASATASVPTRRDADADARSCSHPSMSTAADGPQPPPGDASGRPQRRLARRSSRANGPGSGLTGFGGPPAHIALLRRLIVDRMRWMDAREFEDANAACGLLPGPASTQLAIFCAYRVAGPAGAVVGGLGFIVPAVVTDPGAVGALFGRSRRRLWVRGAGAGAGAAVAAVAAQAGRGLLVPSLARVRSERPRPARPLGRIRGRGGS